ncbi:unnamed protein product [Enterobius vermicularis]|uniref:WD_REPEATS_REGION domain-containing protein n=1 Tax=Enterobius vermicularis TaxID=51028 RepID=A0A0N4VL39_ENTVE|nr:unnamed protein product [Enterobius vermicularis]
MAAEYAGGTTEEVAIFTDHDWYSVIGVPSDGLTIAVNIDNKMKEVGNVLVKDGTLIPECTSLDDKTLVSFHDMRVRRIEKRRLLIALGEFETTYFAPVVNFNDVHRTAILSVDVNCTGKLIVSSSADGSIKIWNSETGELIKRFEGDNMDVNKVRFFPSGLVVLSCGEDMSVRVLSAETGLCYRTFHGHTRGVQDIAFIGVGKDVLSGAKDGTLKIWNCASSECLHTYHPNQGAVNAIVLNSNESDICGIAAEEGASLLDIRSADIVSFTSSFYKLDLHALISRSFVVAFPSDGSVCGYEKTLKRRSALLCFSGADCDPVYDFSIFDDTYLYTCCRDKVIRKYEIVV